jgi:hypothetical protein
MDAAVENSLARGPRTGGVGAGTTHDGPAEESGDVYVLLRAGPRPFAGGAIAFRTSGAARKCGGAPAGGLCGGGSGGGGGGMPARQPESDQGRRPGEQQGPRLAAGGGYPGQWL